MGREEAEFGLKLGLGLVDTRMGSPTTRPPDAHIDGGEVRCAAAASAPILGRPREAERAADGGRDHAFVDTYRAPAFTRA